MARVAVEPSDFAERSAHSQQRRQEEEDRLVRVVGQREARLDQRQPDAAGNLREDRGLEEQSCFVVINYMTYITYFFTHIFYRAYDVMLSSRLLILCTQ